MSAKHYRDEGGVVWELVAHDTYRCVQSAGTVPEGDVRYEYEMRSTLTEVNPYADETTSKAIRAELAIVLTELADEIYSPHSYSGVEDDIRTTVSSLLEEKSRSLRASLGMGD